MYHGAGSSSGTSGQFEPLTRSRTNLFLSYRDTSSTTATGATAGSSSGRYADNEESEQLLGDAERGQVGVGDSLPPEWVDLSERVDGLVRDARFKLAKLDKLHAKHVLPGFKDRTAEEREIDALANEITRDFRNAQQCIRQVAEMAAKLLNSKGKAPTSEARRIEMVMAANVQVALAAKVQEVSSEFRKKQTAYLRQLRGQDRHSTPAKSDPLASLFEDEQYSQSVSSTEQQQQQQEARPEFESRSKEIAGLATSIVELADLFKDLNSLVIDQGTLLDRVDWNIEQMRTEVVKAGEELTAASHYQRRSGKCQLIFLLVLLIIGAVVVIAYKPRRWSVASRREIPWEGGMVDVLPVPDSSLVDGQSCSMLDPDACARPRRSRGRRRI